MIKNMKQMMRPVLFDGLAHGKTMPMDIDAIYDIKGRGTIVYEVKCCHAPMPLGQRLVLEHFVKNTHPDRMAVAVVCDCADNNVDVPIDLATCSIRMGYENGKWFYPRFSQTAKEFTDNYIARVYKRYGIVDKAT